MSKAIVGRSSTDTRVSSVWTTVPINKYKKGISRCRLFTLPSRGRHDERLFTFRTFICRDPYHLCTEAFTYLTTEERPRWWYQMTRQWNRLVKSSEKWSAEFEKRICSVRSMIAFAMINPDFGECHIFRCPTSVF